MGNHPIRFPTSVGGPGRSYILDVDRFAVRGELPAGLPHRAEDRLEGEGITIVRGPLGAAAELPRGSILPVYNLGEGGVAFVATGRATVRFREGTDAAARAPDLRELGYEIERVAPYAPHMAWLRPASGDVAAALAGLDRLAALPDVELVEAQMLSRAERR